MASMQLPNTSVAAAAVLTCRVIITSTIITIIIICTAWPCSSVSFLIPNVRICDLGHRRQIPGALKYSTAFSPLLLQRELHSSGEFKQTTQYQTRMYT
jgi:hypothetical protein